MLTPSEKHSAKAARFISYNGNVWWGRADFGLSAPGAVAVMRGAKMRRSDYGIHMYVESGFDIADQAQQDVSDWLGYDTSDAYVTACAQQPGQVRRRMRDAV